MPPTQVALDPTRPLSVFQALADENRLRIVSVLHEGERCVCDLQSSLDLSQSLLSHHLRVLREAGLVRARREGRWVHYALADGTLGWVQEWIADVRDKARTSSPSPSRC